MKALTDEEMIKHGIHLTARLQQEGVNKESDWADLSDDEDDWTAPPVKWADGAQLNPTQLDGQSAPDKDPVSRREDRAPRISLKPTVVPMPAGSRAEINGRSRGFGGIGQSRLGNLTLKGTSDKQPSAMLKTVAMSSPARSPWAKLPPVEIVSPAHPMTEAEIENAMNSHVDMLQNQNQEDMVEKPQISVDDFQRHGASLESPAMKELFNSTSGRYESVGQMRRLSKGHDQGYRQPAVLQRSADQSEFSRTNTFSAGDRLQSIPTADTDSLQPVLVDPNLAKRQQEPSLPGAPLMDAQRHPSLSSASKGVDVHLGALTRTQDSQPYESDPIALQQKIMQESRALAMKRRKEQEEKDESERKERIKRKLADMDANSHVAQKRLAQNEINPKSTSSTVSNSSHVVQAESGKGRDSPEAARPGSQIYRSHSSVPQHNPQGQQGPISRVDSARQHTEALAKHRYHPGPTVNGPHGEQSAIRSYSPLNADSRSHSAHEVPSVSIPASGVPIMAFQPGNTPIPTPSHPSVNTGMGVSQINPFGRSENAPSLGLASTVFPLPREYETASYRNTTSRYFPSKPGSSTNDRSSLTHGAPGLSQPTNPIGPPGTQTSSWPNVPPSRFPHWQGAPQSFAKASPPTTFVPPPQTEDIWIQTISGPGATRIRTTQPSTNTPEASLRGLNHYDIPAIRPVHNVQVAPPVDNSNLISATSAKGSRFFPMTTPVDHATMSEPVDAAAAPPAAAKEINAEQLVFDQELQMPRVQLPPARPIVRLPPPADDVPSLTSEQDVDPSLSSLTPHDEPQQSMNWQAKFQALIGRGSPAGQMNVKPVQLSPQSTNATATVVLPDSRAQPDHLSVEAGSSGLLARDELSTVSKEGMEDLMAEQEFGSLPPVKLPIQVQVNAWVRPVLFREAYETRLPEPAICLSKEDSSILIERMAEANPSAITVKFPGQETAVVANQSSIPKPQHPGAHKQLSATGRRGPPRRSPFGVKARNRTHPSKPSPQSKVVSQK